jgi:hypothetical protein
MTVFKSIAIPFLWRSDVTYSPFLNLQHHTSNRSDWLPAKCIPIKDWCIAICHSHIIQRVTGVIHSWDAFQTECHRKFFGLRNILSYSFEHRRNLFFGKNSTNTQYIIHTKHVLLSICVLQMCFLICFFLSFWCSCPKARTLHHLEVCRTYSALPL